MASHIARLAFGRHVLQSRRLCVFMVSVVVRNRKESACDSGAISVDARLSAFIGASMSRRMLSTDAIVCACALDAKHTRSNIAATIFFIIYDKPSFTALLSLSLLYLMIN